MEFEFVRTGYIEPSDLREMYLLCKNDGYTPREAMLEVASGWDDCDFHSIGFVEEQVIDEINRRLSQTKFNKGVDK